MFILFAWLEIFFCYLVVYIQRQIFHAYSWPELVSAIYMYIKTYKHERGMVQSWYSQRFKALAEEDFLPICKPIERTTGTAFITKNDSHFIVLN